MVTKPSLPPSGPGNTARLEDQAPGTEYEVASGLPFQNRESKDYLLDFQYFFAAK
jgi:hypothetical protein